jgi:hypothetical protein
VQVDPIKPTLKAPGTVRLKLKYDEPLTKFAFNFNLRRYIQEVLEAAGADKMESDGAAAFGDDSAAGAYTRPPFGLT